METDRENSIDSPSIDRPKITALSHSRIYKKCLYQNLRSARGQQAACYQHDGAIHEVMMRLGELRRKNANTRIRRFQLTGRTGLNTLRAEPDLRNYTTFNAKEVVGPMNHVKRFFRYVFWMILTATVAWIVRKMFQHAATKSGANLHAAANPTVAVQGAKTLFRDPVCGTYIAETISYSLLDSGENLHFCSRDCMERYQRELRVRGAGRLAAGA